MRYDGVRLRARAINVISSIILVALIKPKHISKWNFHFLK